MGQKTSFMWCFKADGGEWGGGLWVVQSKRQRRVEGMGSVC